MEITPQLLVIVQVFVAQRQPVHPLRHQFFHPVLGVRRVAMVPQTGGQLGHDPRPLLHLAQQQAARVAGDRPAVKAALYLASS